MIQVNKVLKSPSERNEDWPMYQSGKEPKLAAAGGATSLITDNSRVYKGASWKDRAYWLNPGTRRFLDQDQSTDAIGFRCAMDRVGSPTSNQRENTRREVDYGK